MKKGLHPEYNTLKVTLTDGSTLETRSTLETGTLKTEVDSKNHPFYTGKQQFVDTAGRVEKFRRRYGDKTTIGSRRAEQNDDKKWDEEFGCFVYGHTVRTRR